MSWTAIVPLKPADARKSRLADRLFATERVALSEAMLAHVAAVLAAHPRVGRIVLLAAERPPGWAADWRPDRGRGLNAELDAAAAGIDGDILVLHADLPLLAAADLDALFDAGGVALAPDRRGLGTNAVAMPGDTRLAASFGEGSFARFLAMYPDAAIVRRPGLAIDVDTPDDLDLAHEAGFRWPR